MGQAHPGDWHPAASCCSTKQCCGGEADHEIPGYRKPQSARAQAPGLPNDLSFGPEGAGGPRGEAQPAVPAAARASDAQAARCREVGGHLATVDEETASLQGVPPGSLPNPFVENDSEDSMSPLAPLPAEFSMCDDADEPLPVEPVSPSEEERFAKCGQKPKPPPPAEVTPEPEHHQPVRRWQSPQVTPSPSRPSRAEEEEAQVIQEVANRLAQTGQLLFTFRLPGGSTEERDFTEYALRGDPLGLDVDMEAPITVGRIAANSPAHKLGIQSGWLITHLGDVSFERQEPYVFCRVVKYVRENLKHKM